MPTAKGLAELGTATVARTYGVRLPDVTEPAATSQVRGSDRGDGSGRTRKYGNRTVELDGYAFASKKEAREYSTLRLMQTQGLIAELRVHPEYHLKGSDGSVVYTYTADFAYLDCRHDYCIVVVDAKSVATRKKDTWRIVKKLFRATFGFDITEL